MSHDFLVVPSSLLTSRPSAYLHFLLSIADFLEVKDEPTRKLGPIAGVKDIRTRFENFTAEVQVVLQTICVAEAVTGDFPNVMQSLVALPTVVEWLQRSAYRRGATSGLTLGAAHFPDDWEHDEMTSGWPSNTGVVSPQRVQEMREAAAPYADRVLRMDTLLPFQATRDAPEDEPAVERDIPAERPLEAARAGTLTTFPVNQWVPTYRADEAGASAPADGEAEDGADDEE